MFTPKVAAYVRPGVTIFLTLVIGALAIGSLFMGGAPIDDGILDLLKTVTSVAYMFYFTARGAEKIASMKYKATLEVEASTKDSNKVEFRE